ncbi:MAG: hypothetical protein RMJ53_08305, partial [Chitinophagales bacterium]|nr:hypothetical protein [Chitinophagales bacterium]
NFCCLASNDGVLPDIGNNFLIFIKKYFAELKIRLCKLLPSNYVQAFRNIREKTYQNHFYSLEN